MKTAGLATRLICTVFLLNGQAAGAQSYATDSVKLKGFYYNGTDQQELNTVKSTGANWVAVTPVARLDKTTGALTIDSTQTAAIANGIANAKKSGLKVMVKPVVEMSGNTPVSALGFSSLKQWDEFEKTYRQIAMYYAKLSDSLGVGLFCMGNDMKTFTQFKRDFFPTLIKALRDSTGLQLTYAANYEYYDAHQFWRELDYIGINAHYPLSQKATPAKDELKRKWVKTKYELKDFAKKTGKPILFTEISYQSCDHCAQSPGQPIEIAQPNDACQANAYDAVCEVFLGQDWFAGVFAMKWIDHGNKGFGVHGSKSKKVLKRWFED